MIQFVLFLACVLVFSVADYLAARWGCTRDRPSLVLALLIGPFAYLLFGHLAAGNSLAKMAAYVNSGIVLASVAAGFLFLSERPNRTTWIALAIIVIGLTMLSFGRVHRDGA